MKLFMLVIMPLITGGALADFLRRFGVRLPRGLEKIIPGMSGGGRSGRYSSFPMNSMSLDMDGIDMLV